MAKADNDPITWPDAGLPIDEALALVLPALWAAWADARDALARRPDDPAALNELRFAANKAMRELQAGLLQLMERGEVELLARLGSPLADPKPVPAVALEFLYIDLLSRIALQRGGRDLPKLYDLRLRQGARY